MNTIHLLRNKFKWVPHNPCVKENIFHKINRFAETLVLYDGLTVIKMISRKIDCNTL